VTIYCSVPNVILRSVIITLYVGHWTPKVLDFSNTLARQDRVWTW